LAFLRFSNGHVVVVSHDVHLSKKCNSLKVENMMVKYLSVAGEALMAMWAFCVAGRARSHLWNKLDAMLAPPPGETTDTN
jgi:hypothetical protein